MHAVVNAAVSSPAVDFMAGAISGGVIGNAAYDLLKNMCHYVAIKFHEKFREKAHQRAASFKQIGDDADLLKTSSKELLKRELKRLNKLQNYQGKKFIPF